MAIRTTSKQENDRYLELIRIFALRPIHSDQELDRAISVIDSLVDRPRLTLAEKDYLDVLSDLVERYESEYHAIPPLSDAEIVQHLIETRGVTQAEVARATGIAESTISEVVAGRRKLNRTHIGKLSSFFGVAPGAFSFDQ